MLAHKTMMFVRAPDENVFIAPFNLVEIFFLAVPLEWWMEKRLYGRINDMVMATIYAPLLFVIAWFEVRSAAEIRSNRSRGEEDDDTVEEWEQMAGQMDFEGDGWNKRVELAKSNVEEEAAVVEVRKLREDVEKLKAMIEQLHAVLGPANGEGSKTPGSTAE